MALLIYSKWLLQSCLGCGTAVPAGASGRRAISSSSSNHILPAWSDLVNEKLEETDLTLVGDVAAAGFVCGKCFRAFEAFHNQKIKLLQSLGEAIKFMNTCRRSTGPSASVRQSALGKHACTGVLEPTHLSSHFRKGHVTEVLLLLLFLQAIHPQPYRYIVNNVACYIGIVGVPLLLWYLVKIFYVDSSWVCYPSKTIQPHTFPYGSWKSSSRLKVALECWKTHESGGTSFDAWDSWSGVKIAELCSDKAIILFLNSSPRAV